MAQNQQGNMNGIGEISTIRDILMGQQMSEDNSRFESIEAELVRVETTINEKIDEMQAQTNARFSALEQEMSERFDRLEELLMENTTQLNQKIEAVSTDDKAHLGQMLSDIGKALMKK